MKRKLLHMAVLIGMFLFVGSNSLAQIITKYSPPSMHGINQHTVLSSALPDKNEYEIKKQGNYQTYIPKKARKGIEGKDSVTVHFQLTYDEENYDLSTLGIYNTESEAILRWYMDTEENVLSVPVGTYDICCLLLNSTSEPASIDGNIWLIKEQVSLSNDTVIAFDAKDAVNKITVETYNPKGERCQLPIIKYSDDYLSYETIEEGNISYHYFSNHMILKDYGMYYSYDGSNEVIAQNFGDNSKCSNVIYTNNVSDRYIFGFSRISSAQGGILYANKYEVSGVDKDVTLKNNPQAFVTYKETFKPSVKGNESETYGAAGLETYITYDGKNYSGIILEQNKPAIDKDKVTIYMDMPKTDGFNVMVAPHYGDMQHMDVYEYDKDGTIIRDTMYSYSFTVGLPVFVDKGNVEYVSVASGYFINTEDGSDPILYPGHQAFSYTNEEKTNVYGNSCPINVFSSASFYSENLGTELFFLYTDYVGRLGERRNTDSGLLQTTFKYKGKIIEELPSEKPQDGVFDLLYTNSNIDVDGIPAKNITQVVFDQAKEDWMAPTLQMLQFRDKNGVVTDRFMAADEGVVEFSGGDFNYKETRRGSYYDCQPQTVAVSYAPYGKDTWQTLAVEEIPDLYRMPGFGYFYRGSLASVTEQSENGWYDLKITLTDESGNQQIQTISPAFKIGEGSGISSATVEDVSIYTYDGYLHVKSDKMVSLSLYTIAGTQVCTVTNAANTPLSTIGLSTGVYVAKVTDGAGNVSVHKVTLK